MYCHNPDSWVTTAGEQRTVDDVVSEVQKYAIFHKASGGGVTFTGGEPFLQAKFLIEMLRACTDRGIHTALDTSGYTNTENARRALRHTDLLMLDIKSINAKTYEKITGVAIDRSLEMLKISREMNIPTWIRYVLVPGLTDDIQELKVLAEYLRPYTNIKKVDVLPFHKEGEYKWEERGIPYKLKETPPPTVEMLQLAREILSDSSSRA